MDQGVGKLFLSRRTLIAGSAALAGVALDVPSRALGASLQASSKPSDGKLEVKVGFPVTWLSADRTQANRLLLPVVVALAWPKNWGSKVTVALHADGRVVDVGNTIQIHGPNGLQATSKLNLEAAGNVTKARGMVALPTHDLSALEMVLPVGVRPSHYPEDNFEDIAPVLVAIRDDLGHQLQLTARPRASGPVAAWGVEIAPGYASTSPRRSDYARSSYRYPVFVRVSSVGPASSPTGQVQVAVDSQMISSYQLSSFALNGTSIDVPAASAALEGNSLTLSVAVSPMAPGDLIEMQLTAEPVENVIANVVKFATVTFVADEVEGAFKRNTGKYSVVDLTSSGSPLFDGVLTGDV